VVVAGADVGIVGWPTTVGVLVEGTITLTVPGSGTLTVGTVASGTLTVGTVPNGTLTVGTVANGTLTLETPTPGTVTPSTPTAGTPTEGTATVDVAAGTDTAPATALTEAPSAPPQRPTRRAFAVLGRRLGRCAGIVSHRAVPLDPPTNTPWVKRYRLVVAPTLAVKLMKKDAFALRVGVSSSMAGRGGDDSPS
jgi:hypothetical protein